MCFTKLRSSFTKHMGLRAKTLYHCVVSEITEKTKINMCFTKLRSSFTKHMGLRAKTLYHCVVSEITKKNKNNHVFHKTHGIIENIKNCCIINH